MQEERKGKGLLIAILLVIILILISLVGFFIYNDYYLKEDTKESTIKEKDTEEINSEKSSTEENKNEEEILASCSFSLTTIDDFDNYINKYNTCNQLILSLDNYKYNSKNINLKIITNYDSNTNIVNAKLYINDIETSNYENLSLISELYFKLITTDSKSSLIFVINTGSQEAGKYLLAFDTNGKAILNLKDVSIDTNGINQTDSIITVTEYGKYKTYMLTDFETCADMNKYIKGKETDTVYQVNSYKFNGISFDKTTKETKIVKDIANCND